VPFFRHRESSFLDALQQSSLSSVGVYKAARELSDGQRGAMPSQPSPSLETSDEPR